MELGEKRRRLKKEREEDGLIFFSLNFPLYSMWVCISFKAQCTHHRHWYISLTVYVVTKVKTQKVNHSVIWSYLSKKHIFRISVKTFKIRKYFLNAPVPKILNFGHLGILVIFTNFESLYWNSKNFIFGQIGTYDRMIHILCFNFCDNI